MRSVSSIILFGSLTALLSAHQADAADLAGGGWRGNWVDNNSGHVGKLRARFKPTRDGNYRATFSGTYYKVIPFVFSTKLNVVGHDNGRTILAGTSRVMGFGGFSYDAVADRHNFNAQYSSGRWVGEFNLSR